MGAFTETRGTAQPGVWYRDFEKESLKRNLLMPSYPASRELCAVGGMVANNAGGELTLRYGKTYYRLKMAGVNGNKYSEVRVVDRINPADRVSIRPNPVKNTAVISIESGYRSVAELGIFTESGLQVHTGRV